MNLRNKPMPGLNMGDKMLILKIIHESKNLHGSDFELTVSIVKKLQEQIKLEKESK